MKKSFYKITIGLMVIFIAFVVTFFKNQTKALVSPNQLRVAMLPNTTAIPNQSNATALPNQSNATALPNQSNATFSPNQSKLVPFQEKKVTILKGEKLSPSLAWGNEFSKYTWSSSDNKIAFVTVKGNIKGKSIGTVTITGTRDNKSIVFNLTVKKKPKKILYLTFDDGPSRSSTPKILKILKKNKVKATFFEIKPAKKNLDLTRRIVKEGHTLALHGVSHDYGEIYHSEKSYRKNLDELRKYFYKKLGVYCSISRFPGGSSNKVSREYNKGIMTRLTKKVHSWGYKYFDWNISSGDAGGVKSSKAVIKNVKKTLPKIGAGVVLMHDFANNKYTINALDKVIKYGKKQGYTFLPITSSTEEVHHTVMNN